MVDIPSRSPSGVRIAGDDFQHLVTLNEILVKARSRQLEAVSVEAHDAESVDDVVLYMVSGEIEFCQVKHAVNATTPVGSDMLMQSKGSGRSLLQKLYGSWLALSNEGSTLTIRLITDRGIDASDVLVRCYDTLTHRLLPDAAGSARAMHAARELWCTHLDISEDELLRFLGDFRLSVGVDTDLQHERLDLLLATLGLNSDANARSACLQYVRDWVKGRERRRDAGVVLADLERLLGRASPPEFDLAIEGIDELALADDADHVVRFVELYEGDDARSRATLQPAYQWDEDVKPLFAGLTAVVESAGVRHVAVRAHMRLPAWFAVGFYLPDTRGFVLSAVQHAQRWSSDASEDQPVQLAEPLRIDVDQGADLAIAVSVSRPIGGDVHAYLVAAELPVAAVVELSPEGTTRINSADDAATYVRLLRDQIAQEMTTFQSGTIHLFLNVPAALALLLGARWNRMPRTILYEHIGSPTTYEATFELT